jgi:isocitrate/isopropylmalate dehydrogenase
MSLIDENMAAMRQALEALLGQRGEPDWHTGQQRENAIAALRERLGEGAKP